MSPNNRLDKLRLKVENLDQKILHLLGRRFKLTGQIQKLKIGIGIEILQKKREQALLTAYKKLAVGHSLPEEFIRKLFSIIFSYSKKAGIIRGTKKAKWKIKSKNRNR